jgi:phosphoribosylaminoimidazole carboxylase
VVNLVSGKRVKKAVFSFAILMATSAYANPEAEPNSIPETPRAKVLGILGGGQLGRMLALSAADLGVKVMVLDPSERPPAAVASQAMKGHFRDAESVQSFASKVDVLTIEIEHVDAKMLTMLEDQEAVEIQPSAKTIAIIQDKFAQKEHFKRFGVPLGQYCDIPDEEALLEAANAYGYPFMLKSRRLAYDGRGNYVVHSREAHCKAVEKLGGYAHGLYAEKWQPFEKELAVMVVRSKDGELKLYPVTQTVQRDSICHVTETPAHISQSARIAAELLAKQVMSAVQGAGVFGIEMFLLADDEILLNEVAPRVHNSGHYTIDGCVTSQFENHLRATLGLPLGDTSLIVEHVIMLNILGEADGKKGEQLAERLIDCALATPGCSVHWYDKSGVTTGRKIGHINIVGKSLQEVRDRLRALDPKALERLSS